MNEPPISISVFGRTLPLQLLYFSHGTLIALNQFLKSFDEYTAARDSSNFLHLSLRRSFSDFKLVNSGRRSVLGRLVPVRKVEFSFPLLFCCFNSSISSLIREIVDFKDSTSRFSYISHEKTALGKVHRTQYPLPRSLIEVDNGLYQIPQRMSKL